MKFLNIFARFTIFSSRRILFVRSNRGGEQEGKTSILSFEKSCSRREVSNSSFSNSIHFHLFCLSERGTFEETFSRCVFFERNRDKSYYLWGDVITFEGIKALGSNLTGPFPGSRRIVCHARSSRTEKREAVTFFLAKVPFVV